MTGPRIDRETAESMEEDADESVPGGEGGMDTGQQRRPD